MHASVKKFTSYKPVSLCTSALENPSKNIWNKTQHITSSNNHNIVYLQKQRAEIIEKNVFIMQINW